MKYLKLLLIQFFILIEYLLKYFNYFFFEKSMKYSYIFYY